MCVSSFKEDFLKKDNYMFLLRGFFKTENGIRTRPDKF